MKKGLKNMNKRKLNKNYWTLYNIHKKYITNKLSY